MRTLALSALLLGCSANPAPTETPTTLPSASPEHGIARTDGAGTAAERGDDRASPLDGLAKRVDAAASRVAEGRRAIAVEGEDATSAFATIRWIGADGSVLQIRWVWNGGCCSSPTVTELLFDGAELLRERVLAAPAAEAAALMRGEAPQRPTLAEELLFRGDRLVRWTTKPSSGVVAGGPESATWRAREERSRDLVSSLRDRE